ncbi:MAG: hypothetical protein F9K19_09045 [Rhizobiaceae bacterium]|nr:MAG: hypothetical protein F9K19_09045 [Rhizobiaceae bacterium]CAG0969885.1 hypothetical protein RHIZO_01166 [Rhizobiaceae bacterium]
MCFSATASFATAAMTGVAGIAAVAMVRAPRDLPLAAMPLFFAAQQAVEGFLWLGLAQTPPSPATTALTYAFLVFAQVFWPVWAPVAALAIEPSPGRRRAILACLASGTAIAAYLGWDIASRAHTAAIVGGHIVYTGDYSRAEPLALAYLAATALPLLLSSRRAAMLLGVIILIGSAVAYDFYREAFVSVWCFFAAAASAVILTHFERARRRATAAAVAKA